MGRRRWSRHPCARARAHTRMFTYPCGTPPLIPAGRPTNPHAHTHTRLVRDDAAALHRSALLRCRRLLLPLPRPFTYPLINTHRYPPVHDRQRCVVRALAPVPRSSVSRSRFSAARRGVVGLKHRSLSSSPHVSPAARSRRVLARARVSFLLYPPSNLRA